MHKQSNPPLSVVARPTEPETGVRHADEIASALADVLGDTYVLILKTHVCHWNVEGPLFYSVHNLTESQYEDMFAAADVIAERIRALGRLAPSKIGEMTDRAAISETPEQPSARAMIRGLAESHAQIAQRLRRLIRIAGEGDDAVTEDLATGRAAFHEKAAWMLNAMIVE